MVGAVVVGWWWCVTNDRFYTVWRFCISHTHTGKLVCESGGVFVAVGLLLRALQLFLSLSEISPPM